MRSPRFKQVTGPVVEGYDVKCDLCGYGDDPDMIWPVAIQVDLDGCAGTSISRDVCYWCYHDVLAKHTEPLFTLLKAGDEELGEYHGDRWYG